MNILRSLTRAVARALGPEWEVGPGIEGTIARPYAAVTPSTPAQSVPHGRLYRDVSRGFAISAWPVAFTVTPDAALTEAARVEALLRDAFTGGPTPMRLALFDYAAVAPGQPALDVASWARVTDCSVGLIGDPADDTAFVIVGDVRLSWNESLGEPDTAPHVERVTITDTGSN